MAMEANLQTSEDSMRLLQATFQTCILEVSKQNEGHDAPGRVVVGGSHSEVSSTTFAAAAVHFGHLQCKPSALNFVKEEVRSNCAKYITLVVSS